MQNSRQRFVSEDLQMPITPDGDDEIEALAAHPTLRFYRGDAKLAAEARELRSWPFHIEGALNAVSLDGLFCEFGVWRGGTLTHFIRSTAHFWHGFDSFRGLPGRFGDEVVGHLDLGGKAPEGKDLTPERVRFHVGAFAATLPAFLAAHAGPIAFAHIDCDLYESTATVLALARDRIIPGTVLVFDEYITGDGHDERAALIDSGIPFRCLSHHVLGGSVAVIVV
jgi:hypothetical protein